MPGKRRNNNTLRIIGGQWRGRRLRFPPRPGLRPTPDRVRETVFNWLQGRVEGARCLDLFAGSGALGFEAASRGAGELWMVDANRQVVQGLEANIALLGAAGVRPLAADVRRFLQGPARPFDLVFLDPPYHHRWLETCLPLLAQGGWLAPNALVYLEAEAELDPLPLPSPWVLLRSKTAGQVGYHLVGTNSAV